MPFTSKKTQMRMAQLNKYLSKNNCLHRKSSEQRYPSGLTGSVSSKEISDASVTYKANEGTSSLLSPNLSKYHREAFSLSMNTPHRNHGEGLRLKRAQTLMERSSVEPRMNNGRGEGQNESVLQHLSVQQRITSTTESSISDGFQDTSRSYENGNARVGLLKSSARATDRHEHPYDIDLKNDIPQYVAEFSPSPSDFDVLRNSQSAETHRKVSIECPLPFPSRVSSETARASHAAAHRSSGGFQISLPTASPDRSLLDNRRQSELFTRTARVSCDVYSKTRKSSDNKSMEDNDTTEEHVEKPSAFARTMDLEGTPSHRASYSPVHSFKPRSHVSSTVLTTEEQQPPVFHEHVYMGDLVSLGIPEHSLFLSMPLPFWDLSSLISSQESCQGTSSDMSSSRPSMHSFPAGLLNFYLTPGCNRTQKIVHTKNISNIKPKGKHAISSSDSATKAVEAFCVTSSQEVLFLPVLWLLDTLSEVSEQNKKIESMHAHNTTDNSSSSFTRSAFPYDGLRPVLETDTPCFLCLPMHVSNDQEPTGLFSSSVAWCSMNTIREADPLTTEDSLCTDLIACLLQVKRPEKSCDWRSCHGYADTFHSSISDDVEFYPTRLNLFISEYKQEILKHKRLTEGGVSNQHDGRSSVVLKRSKREVLLQTLMLQIIRKHAAFEDVVWILEKIDRQTSPYSAALAAEPINVRTTRYLLRNFKGDYLIVERYAPNESLITRLPRTDTLQYRLALRSSLDCPTETHLMHWTINHNFRPLEPSWLTTDLRGLHCPQPVECIDSGHLLKTSIHLANPLESLQCNLPTSVQEMLLVEDLLFCFTGISGLFITYRYMKDEICDIAKVGSALMNKVKHGDTSKDDVRPSLVGGIIGWYGVSDSIGFESSVLEMTKRFLCILRVYRKICRFVEVQGDIRFGLCNQAFTEAIQHVLTEFQEHIIGLETFHREGNLSLQKFWFFIQPASALFQILEKIVDAVHGLRGGSLLNALTGVYNSLSRVDSSRALCCKLLKATAAPLTENLISWVTKGVILDPQQEFWITDDISVSPESRDILSLEPHFSSPFGNLFQIFSGRSESTTKPQQNAFGGHPYWYQKFYVKDTQDIPQLFSLVAENALEAGKHINILVSCLNNGLLREDLTLHDTLDRGALGLDSSLSLVYPNFCQKIIEASHHAAKRLLDYLFVKCHLMSRLLSIRRFMFFSRSDMIFGLLSLIEEEVKNTNLAKIIGRLNLIFDTATSSSSLSHDPHRKMFYCTLSYYNTRELSPLLQYKGHNDLCAPTPVTHEVISLATGIPFSRRPPELDVDYSYPNALLTTHPLLHNTHILKPESFSFSFPLDAVCSTTQTSNIQKYQELIKYLTLSFELSWPLTLIFTRVVTLKYQLLSRLVLQLKFTEKKLAEIWKCQMRCDPRVSKLNCVQSPLYLSYMLRIRMLHFVRNFSFYVSVEVLEPRFHEFFSHLEAVHSLKDIIELHNSFLNTCLDETLLTESNFIRCLSKILTVCHLYSSTATKFSLYRMESSSASAVVADGSSQPTNGKKKSGLHNHSASYTMSEEQFGALVKQYSTHFERNLKHFLILLMEAKGTAKSPSDALRSTTHVHNLLTRLDFNGFYSKLYQLNLDNCELDNSHTE